MPAFGCGQTKTGTSVHERQIAALKKQLEESETRLVRAEYAHHLEVTGLSAQLDEATADYWSEVEIRRDAEVSFQKSVQDNGDLQLRLRGMEDALAAAETQHNVATSLADSARYDRDAALSKAALYTELAESYAERLSHALRVVENFNNLVNKQKTRSAAMMTLERLRKIVLGEHLGDSEA